MTTILEERKGLGNGPKLKIAIEGCGHGMLDSIYKSVETSCEQKGWGLSEVDFLIICGDFQAVRNSLDLNCMAVPAKYRELGDFHAYYSGGKKAPILTFVIGGNHEASNYFFELYHGGWLAENIYYMGAANVVRYGPMRIAAMSGIWKGYDFRKNHYERLPYNKDDIKSIFHVREYDVRKLLQIRTQVDIGISHDWPRGIEVKGNSEWLFRKKPLFREDSESGRLGNIAAERVLSRLRPAYWFSGHLHVKYSAVVKHAESVVAAVVKHETPPHVEPPKNVQAPQADIRKVENTDEIEVLLSSDSDKQAAPSPPKAVEKKAPTPMPVVDREVKLNAWNSFHQKARKEEGEDAARSRAEQAARLAEERRTGIRNVKQFKIDETWRRVEVGEGTSREVVEAKKRKMGDQAGGPSDEYDSQASNPDEIKLNLNGSSSDDASEAPEVSKVRQTVSTNVDEFKVNAMDSSDEHIAPQFPSLTTPSVNPDVSHPKIPQEYVDAQLSAGKILNITTAQNRDGEVPAHLRALLPDSFSRVKSPTKALNATASPPAKIKNTETHFLALDKVGPRRDFLQLAEVEPVPDVEEAESTMDSAPRSADGKYRLQYDPEWLAITRTFASTLEVGDPSIPSPQDMGEAFYADSIEQHLEWVKEHIVDQDRLEIPTNFSIIAPVYDVNDVVADSDQPQEYPNPQTDEFCEMLGIPNKLSISEAELQARMEAGPRQENPRNDDRRFGGYGGRGRGGFRGAYGGRGGGGQRGGRRGGFRGGRGGRQNRSPASKYDGPSSDVNPDHESRPGGSSRRGGGERPQNISPSQKPTMRSESSSHGGSWASLPLSSHQKSTMREERDQPSEIPWGSQPDPAYRQSGHLIRFN